MIIPLSIESPNEVTCHGIEKIVLPEEKYQNLVFFLPVRSHSSVFAEGSILQHLDLSLIQLVPNSTELYLFLQWTIVSYPITRQIVPYD